MVRLSKQKQERLENIMNLVEELGVDRVLARLRQTKMMSKEVLDDMKEWETDYEKRVALLGFLVSPEGKRAFGALFELAKVHEEQVRLQEEQEKLRQEQLAQRQAGGLSVDSRRSGGHGGATTGGKQSQVGGSNMKNKLRAQLIKRKTPTAQPAQQTNSHHASPAGKTKKASNKKQEDKDDPLLEEAARTLEAAQRQVQEKKRMDAMRTQLAASETRESSSTPSGRRSAGSPRTTPTPRSEGGSQSQVPESPKTSNLVPKSTDAGSTSPSPSKRKHSESEEKFSNGPPKSVPEPKKQSTKVEPQHIPKALNDFTRHKQEEERHKLEEGEWGKMESIDMDEDENDEESEHHLKERFPPEEKSLKEDERNQTHKPPSNAHKHLTELSNSEYPMKRVEEEASDEEHKHVFNANLSGPILKLLSGELEAHCMKRCDLDTVVGEWRTLRKERGGHIMDAENKAKLIHQLKEEAKAIEEEKERMRKEKDKFVYKEFNLQQKLQDLTQKHRNLKEEHDSLKHGNYQIQQNTKKTNKLHQDMKKKIAKLESKIKSMDKVTIRRGTQTEDHPDKDVYEALRMAEESLSVTQGDLATAQGKLKAVQQEVDDYKKQLNIKGREINKRERKSKKDEDTIRFVSRERDAMETKLRKMIEQMEYYKGMMDTKGKTGKKPPPEKKEVKVQRCASGRHILVKSVASCQQHHTDGDGEERPPSRVSRPGTVKQSNKTKTAAVEKQAGANKKASSSSNPAKINGATSATENRGKQASSGASDNKADATTKGASAAAKAPSTGNSASTTAKPNPTTAPAKSGNAATGKTVSSGKSASQGPSPSDTNKDAATSGSKSQSSSGNGVEAKSKSTTNQAVSNGSKASKKPPNVVDPQKPRKSSLKDSSSVPQVANKS